MMKVSMKRICSVIMGIVFAISLVACGGTKKEAMTSKEFQTAMEKKGFTVTDNTKEAKDNSYLQINVACEDGKYSFEYYTMKDENSANNVYDYAANNLKTKYKDNNKAKVTEKKTDKISNYSVAADDYSVWVKKNDNTVLYVTAYAESAKEAEKIIKDLGY